VNHAAAPGSIAIVDNGGANVASLRYALERLGVSAELTGNAEQLRRASHVILPGVGAAGDAMQRLHEHRLDELLRDLRQPVLGICLGMQLFFEYSDEGATTCLGVLPGQVRRLVGSADRPVPHMGWNQLRRTADSPLLDGIADGEYVYFVHSYAVSPLDCTIAACDYGGEFSAVVSRDNFHGVQFHPERSAAAGARILANFLSLPA
jgi:glutamine amidotransferase